MTYKSSVASGLLGEQRTRWMDYQPYRSIEEKLELASKIKGLDGIELGYPNDFQDVNKIKSLLSDHSLEVSSVNLKVRGPELMYDGSFSSPNKEAVTTAIDWGKEALDAAATFNCNVVTTCPLNDGYDYPFEMDYQVAWQQTVDSIRQVAAHRQDVNIAIEYKLSDPRTRSLISNVGEALLLARQTGQDNVGVTLDFGHALIARENPSHAAILAAEEQRLFLVHMNDNDRVADIDLMTGSIHYWETLEFFYYLRKINYRGWIVADVYPKENDPAQIFSQTISRQKRFAELANELTQTDIGAKIKNRDLIGVFEKLTF